MDRNIERPMDRPIERLIDFHMNGGVYSYPDTPLASIPTGSVVYDTTDGVVKRKVGDYLVDIQYNVIGYGPIEDAPVASGNLGGFYLDTGDPAWPSGRLYMSRYNGNYINNGVSTATDNVVPAYSFNANLDFHLSLKFRQDMSNSVAYTGLFCQGTSVASSRGLWIERVGTTANYALRFYNSSGVAKETIINAIIDDKWHFLEVIRVGNSVFVYNDGVLIGTMGMSEFTVNEVTTTTIGAQVNGVRAINGNVAECSVICSTGCFTYEFNQSTGSTILDTSGNENHGTLTDASPTDFWRAGWTPMQWLTT